MKNISNLCASSRLRGDDVACLLRHAFAVIPLLASFAIGINPAFAHPDVWITSASELIYAADGSLTGLRHAWTFDEGYSTSTLDGIESKTKGVFTREELAPLAKVNVESLKEFGYFTFVTADGRKQKFLEPAEYYLEYNAPALVLHFTLPFRAPVKARQLKLEVYDPTLFVEFSLQQQQPVTLVAAPASCKLEVQRPEQSSTKPQAGELPKEPEHSARGTALINRIMVDCP